MRVLTLDAPFREAAATVDSGIILGAMQDVAIGGRTFVIDTADTDYRYRFKWMSVDAQRPQQDTSNFPGEQTLTVTDMWRRVTSSWHHGSGQRRYDDATSDAARFWASKGVDVWTKWQMSLMNDTSLTHASSGSLQSACITQGTVVHLTGRNVYTTTDLVYWPLIATVASDPTTNLVSDGYEAWVGCANGHVYSTTMAGTVTDRFTLGGSVDSLDYAKGRWWMGQGQNLYGLLVGGTVTPLAVVPPTGWKWTSYCEGQNGVYAAGYSGDRSQVYLVTITAAAALDAPRVAATLPDGEVVQSMTSYLGYIVLGTSKGVRFCVSDASGFLTLGSVIPTDSAVMCFEPQDRFVWYGLTNFDDDSTGLGRLDLSAFTSDLTPAHASDLMASGQGVVSSVLTWNDTRLFTVNGVGLYSETDTKVGSGYLQTGDITYGIPNDLKSAISVTLSHLSLVGSVELRLSADGSAFGVLGESSTPGTVEPIAPITFNPIDGRRFNLEFVLNSDSGSGPTVTSTTFNTRIRPKRVIEFIIPILLTDITDRLGTFMARDTVTDQEYLIDLVKTGLPVTLQLAGGTWQVFPVDFVFFPDQPVTDGSSWMGTWSIYLREVTP